MSGNWFKSPVADWPVVAELLPRPWPIEAVRIDLAYLADRSKMAGEQIPGRPALAERWGWSDRKTRTILEQIKSKTHEERPTSVQRASSDRPAGQRFDDVFEEETSNERPTSVQRASSDEASPYNNNIQTTDTEHITSKEKEINKEKEISPPQERVANIEFVTPFSTDEKQSVGLQPCFLTSDIPEGQPPIGECYKTHDVSVLEPVGYDDIKSDTESNGEANALKEMASTATGTDQKRAAEMIAFVVDDYGLVIKHWLSRIPNDPTPPLISSASANIRSAIDRYKLENCYLVIDWAFDSNHDRAVYLGNSGNRTLKTLFNPDKFYEYLGFALGWERNGRKDHVKKTGPPKDNPFAVNAKHGDYDEDYWSQEIEFESTVLDRFKNAGRTEDM